VVQTTYQPPEQPTQQLSVAPEPQYESCEECGTPVDKDQRYCVVCGTRRKHVYDPAARFLATATSRNRRGSGPGGPAPAAARPRRFQNMGTALAIAVIPVAIALGVVLGKSGPNNERQLLDAIRSEKPAVVNVSAGGGGGAVASTTGTTHAIKTAKSKAGKSSGNGGSSNAPKKVLAKTSNGTFTSLTTTKPPSRQQLAQNANIVKQVQNTISNHYVDSQKNLPNSIAVP
jgi:hypothetical protein